MTCRSQVRLPDVTGTVDKLMGQAMGKTWKQMGQARDPSPKHLFCLFAVSCNNIMFAYAKCVTFQVARPAAVPSTFEV